MSASSSDESIIFPNIFVGYGYDLHKFKTSEAGYIVLGGIKIEHDKDIDAHSDGDVILHALVDALLGAAGSGDIGEYFPSSDAEWKNRESSYFVEYVFNMISLFGYCIGNVDVTVVAESPKMTTYKTLIRNNISSMLNMNPNRVNIKAKTSEGLGFLGKNEAVEAHVITTLFLKQK